MTTSAQCWNVLGSGGGSGLGCVKLPDFTLVFLGCAHVEQGLSDATHLLANVLCLHKRFVSIDLELLYLSIESIVRDTRDPSLLFVFDFLPKACIIKFLQCRLQLFLQDLHAFLSLVNVGVNGIIILLCLSDYNLVLQNFFGPSLLLIALGVFIVGSLLWSAAQNANSLQPWQQGHVLGKGETIRLANLLHSIKIKDRVVARILILISLCCGDQDRAIVAVHDESIRATIQGVVDSPGAQ
ncbi:hypothetical protein FB192DRAFT_1350752 [Mucor lusitanicus]|uniref:Uncharacterized protein n=1 Tax=Mucor circinelloides f. lusitanicus TaxID=29924 RepID=A0A8H4F689_MUCCL|nr:hypothetical protein FB192DRAFT_1350752 [Mucor lusitanicus]